MEESRKLLETNDIDTWIAYYCFVNHGTLPHDVATLEPREKALIFAMAEREIKNRPK